MLLLLFDTVFTLMLKENKRQKIITFDIFHVSLGQFFPVEMFFCMFRTIFGLFWLFNLVYMAMSLTTLKPNICTMHGLVETLQTIEAALFKGEKVHKKQ